MSFDPNNAFIPDIDELNIPDTDDLNNNNKTSRKTSSLWTYVDCKTLAHPGIPVCKRCNYVFSIKSGNSSIERHLLSKHNIVIPKVKQTTLKFKCIDPWPAKEKSERDHAIVI